MSQSAAQNAVSHPSQNSAEHPAQNRCQNTASSRSGQSSPSVLQTAEERAEESRRIRLLDQLIFVVMRGIQQDQALPVEQASEMAAAARRTALRMFPDKAQTFDMLLWPRLQRLMRERYRMQ